MLFAVVISALFSVSLSVPLAPVSWTQHWGRDAVHGLASDIWDPSVQRRDVHFVTSGQWGLPQALGYSKGIDYVYQTPVHAYGGLESPAFAQQREHVVYVRNSVGDVEPLTVYRKPIWDYRYPISSRFGQGGFEHGLRSVPIHKAFPFLTGTHPFTTYPQVHAAPLSTFDRSNEAYTYPTSIYPMSYHGYGQPHYQKVLYRAFPNVIATHPQVLFPEQHAYRYVSPHVVLADHQLLGSGPEIPVSTLKGGQYHQGLKGIAGWVKSLTEVTPYKTAIVVQQ